MSYLNLCCTIFGVSKNFQQSIIKIVKNIKIEIFLVEFKLDKPNPALKVFILQMTNIIQDASMDGQFVPFINGFKNYSKKQSLQKFQFYKWKQTSKFTTTIQFLKLTLDLKIIQNLNVRNILLLALGSCFAGYGVEFV
eukprot:TRINITY_DN7530_c0_g1_i2.p3 TRINITY_DN7530_c0_g1~~TRINITY_DN7530_c0_g1_i2.p3  ORF type:complete len:138 (+),score=10.81 TRINITY_DN7530_c0_g1_i2:533-946(+)